MTAGLLPCCSQDALTPVGLARYDVDRLSAPLVGGLAFRFTSMLKARPAQPAWLSSTTLPAEAVAWMCTHRASTNLMQQHLALAMQKQRSWTPSSACCWRRLLRRCSMAVLTFGRQAVPGTATLGLPSVPALQVQLLHESAQGFEADACGVYVGASFEDYGRLASEATGVTPYTATGTTASVISGRISYSFALRGPALTIDTGASRHATTYCLTPPGLLTPPPPPPTPTHPHAPPRPCPQHVPRLWWPCMWL